MAGPVTFLRLLVWSIVDAVVSTDDESDLDECPSPLTRAAGPGPAALGSLAADLGSGLGADASTRALGADPGCGLGAAPSGSALVGDPGCGQGAALGAEHSDASRPLGGSGVPDTLEHNGAREGDADTLGHRARPRTSRGPRVAATHLAAPPRNCRVWFANPIAVVVGPCAVLAAYLDGIAVQIQAWRRQAIARRCVARLRAVRRPVSLVGVWLPPQAAPACGGALAPAGSLTGLQAAELHGRATIWTDSGGGCQFSAVAADADVFDDATRHGEVRRVAVGGLRARPHAYAPFVEHGSDGEPLWDYDPARPYDYTSFLAFVDELAKTGTHGCHVSLAALMWHYRRPAKLISALDASVLVHPAPGVSGGRPFVFVHTRETDVTVGHYEATVALEPWAVVAGRAPPTRSPAVAAAPRAAAATAPSAAARQRVAAERAAPSSGAARRARVRDVPAAPILDPARWQQVPRRRPAAPSLPPVATGGGASAGVGRFAALAAPASEEGEGAEVPAAAPTESALPSCEERRRLKAERRSSARAVRRRAAEAEAAALATAVQLAATESAAAEAATLAAAAEEPSPRPQAPRGRAPAATPEPLTGAEQQVLLVLTMVGAAAAAAAAGEAEAAVALAAEHAAMDVATATLRAEGAAEAAYVQAELEATRARFEELPGGGALPAGPCSSNADIVARGRRAEALRDRALGKCSACGTEVPLHAGFSNKERELVARGEARCRVCVAAACRTERASGPVFETESRAVSASARDAAFEAYQGRVGARREALRVSDAAAAAAAAAAEVAAGGAVPEPVFFGSSCAADPSGGAHACFSSSYPAPFVDSMGREFANVEQFVMHRKATTMGDEVSAALILAEPDPAKARALGRAVCNFDKQRWARYAPVWGEDAVWRKFSGDAELAAVLLGTGERPLVAASAGDAVWGVGMDAAACRAALPCELEDAVAYGNLWGKCLSRVRARLRFRARLAAHDGVVPLCSAEGGVDFEALADLLELYARTVPLAERAVVCSRTGHRWQDEDLIPLLRDIKVTGGVPASAESLAELAKGDRCHGGNGRLTLDELTTALTLLADEESKGWVTKYATREELREAGFDNVWVSPVLLADKMSDGGRKLKSVVDLVTGVVRDGVHHPLMPQSRWCDHDSKESSKGAEDSINDLSPMTKDKLHSKLDDVPYVARVAMALMSKDGELGPDELRAVEGSTVDVSSAYRLLPLARSARALHAFKFLDPDEPIPAYVLGGGQPRDEDCVWFVKSVMPFGWVLSVDYWIRLSKAVKALHLWDGCPPLRHRVPRAADGSRQHDMSVYIDDAGLYALEGLGQLAQDRYLELLAYLRIPVSMEKLEAEGGVTTALHMLGVIFDFATREMRLSPARLEALKRRCREMRDKKVCTREEYDSLVGVLSFCASCVAGGSGRTFMRSLYDLQRRRGGWVRLTRGAGVDLNWWLRFVEEYNGESMMLDDYFTTAEELGLYTDASLEAFGACWVRPDGTAEYFSGRWDEVLPGIDTRQVLPDGSVGEWHISELEALVVLMAMDQWGSHFGGRKIITRCDNESAVAAINRMRCVDPGMHTAVKELWFTKMAHSFDVRCRHVKSEDNKLGDLPSRWTRADGSRDAAAEREFFEFVGSVYGVARADMTEVEPSLDTRGLLRRMQRAHHGAGHRLNGEGGEAEQ